MNSRVAFAALDLGTSRWRAGVIDREHQFRVIADVENRVTLGAGGAARCKFSEQWSAATVLLAALGKWSRETGVEQLHIGVCGQVSSLLRWHDGADQPVEDDYPIWMDSTCQDAVADTAALWNDGGAQRILGTCMPAVTTWLAVKARSHARKSPNDHSRVLQIQDAIFQRLTGECLSHPSSQVSLINQETWSYAPEMLAFCGLSPERLPRIASNGAVAMKALLQSEFTLPPTIVHAGMMDTHAAFYGMFPQPGDGLLLTGTSEVIGVYERSPRSKPPQRMVRARLGDDWIVYGSSTSGGSSVKWLSNILGCKSPADLDAMTTTAAAIQPGCDGLVCLPYFSGERAPLWDTSLTGSFIGLRAEHTPAHLLRALFEGIAFTRRQAAGALECPMPARFLVAGGGAVNALMNSIRASVFNRPLHILVASDLALIGALRQAMTTAGQETSTLKNLLTSRVVAPNAEWLAQYDAGYARFISVQTSMGIGTAHA